MPDTCETCEFCVILDTVLSMCECDNQHSPFYRTERELDWCCPWREPRLEP